MQTLKKQEHMPGKAFFQTVIEFTSPFLVAGFIGYFDNPLVTAILYGLITKAVLMTFDVQIKTFVIWFKKKISLIKNPFKKK